MAIQGSVVDTQTVTTLVEKASTVAFPTNGLTVVGVFFGGQYVKIPLDSSRNAILTNSGANATAGQVTQGEGTMRRVHWTINGTSLNYSGLAKGTSMTVCFYYGSPLPRSIPLAQFAGIVATSTLSSGAGTATFTFPSGNLTMVGFSASSTLTANTAIIEATWATSSGQTFSAFFPMNVLTQSSMNEDIISLSLPVSITVAVTITLGTGSDVVYLYAYYQ
jgi:hypothetical protein